MNKPSWWNEADTTSWERVREALRRDWQQTKHDLHAGGHELNQDVDHTLSQASGGEAIPPIDVPNPPQVVARWEDAEMAIGFGYAARTHYGDLHPKWSRELDRALEKDWKSDIPWDQARIYVCHGYEIRH